MKLNRLTEDSPFSFTFSRSFRVGGEVQQRQDNFLTPPKLDEDDAARVLFSSRGEFKIDGKGEELPLEKRGPQRNTEVPSVLTRALSKLSSITKDIKSIQGNIERGEYGTEAQSQTANDELTKLRAEYERVVQSDGFQKALKAVQRVRSELSGLSEEELFGHEQGKLPLIGAALQLAADQQDASTVASLTSNLERLAKGVSEGTSVEALERIQESITKAISIDNGGKEVADDSGQLEVLLGDLRETVRRLQFLQEGTENGLFSEEQLESVAKEERELRARYRAVLQSDTFSEILASLENVTRLRNSKGGAPAAAAFAAEQRGILGGAFSDLLLNYRLADIDKVSDGLRNIGEAAIELEALSSFQLGRLSDDLSKAIAVVSGDTLGDESPGVTRRYIDLSESLFEKYQRKYQSDLADEIEDFFRVTQQNSRDAYFLNIEKFVSKGNLLDILS